MITSLKGILEIAEIEGIVPAPYLDSRNNWTFGVGHTAAAGGLNPAVMPKGMPDDIDDAIDYAIDVFMSDLIKYEKRVNDAIKVPLEQHEFDALVSFDFNTGGIYRAELTKAINQDDVSASRHFMGWVKPPEVRNRRLSEKHLFETGDYDANGDMIPVWKVDAAGKLLGIHSTISGARVIDRLGVRKQPSLIEMILDLIRRLFG